MDTPKWVLQRDAVYVLRFPHSGYMLPVGQVKIIRSASDMKYVAVVNNSFGNLTATGPRRDTFIEAESDAEHIYRKYMKAPLIMKV